MGGMVGSSPAAVLSSILSDFPNILVIVSNTNNAEALRSECELFSGEKAHLLPAPDMVAGEEFQPAKELMGERETKGAGE